MTKRKLQRFAELEIMKRVFQYPYSNVADQHNLKGNWNKNVFMREAPLIVELGCGRGEYTVGLAARYPQNNYVGVDIKGARLWRGAKTANDDDMKHVAFLRTNVELTPHFFEPHEIDEIWLTFPDPQPSDAREVRRLTNHKFLITYFELLKPGGILHLKTDSTFLFDYTLDNLSRFKGEFIQQTSDLYSQQEVGFDLSIKTTYEKLFSDQGFKICYLAFRQLL